MRDYDEQVDSWNLQSRIMNSYESSVKEAIAIQKLLSIVIRKSIDCWTEISVILSSLHTVVRTLTLDQILSDLKKAASLHDLNQSMVRAMIYAKPPSFFRNDNPLVYIYPQIDQTVTVHNPCMLVENPTSMYIERLNVCCVLEDHAFQVVDEYSLQWLGVYRGTFDRWKIRESTEEILAFSFFEPTDCAIEEEDLACTFNNHLALFMKDIGTTFHFEKVDGYRDVEEFSTVLRLSWEDQSYTEEQIVAIRDQLEAANWGGSKSTLIFSRRHGFNWEYYIPTHLKILPLTELNEEECKTECREVHTSEYTDYTLILDNAEHFKDYNFLEVGDLYRMGDVRPNIKSMKWYVILSNLIYFYNTLRERFNQYMDFNSQDELSIEVVRDLLYSKQLMIEDISDLHDTMQPHPDLKRAVLLNHHGGGGHHHHGATHHHGGGHHGGGHHGGGHHGGGQGGQGGHHGATHHHGGGHGGQGGQHGGGGHGATTHHHHGGGGGGHGGGDA
jgi:hypothetical protein